MPKKISEGTAERSRTHAFFEEAQVRKNFMVPKQLVRVLEHACEKYDCSESEFLKETTLHLRTGRLS